MAKQNFQTVDNCDAKMRQLEQKIEILSKQQQCNHLYIDASITYAGFIRHAKCRDCGRTLISSSDLGRERLVKRLRKYIVGARKSDC